MSGADPDRAAVETRIAAYLAGLPGTRQADLRALHARVQALLPGAPLWFLDGRNAEGKVVSNPNIGYGTFQKTYAGGTSRPFYKVGISANSSGLSVYLMTIGDRAYLARTYGASVGKAVVTGYCIKFRSLGNVDLPTLDTAILDAAARL